MTDSTSLIAELLAVGCAGLVLGWIYYGGLWLTLRRVIHWRQPALGMLASLMLRLAIVAIGLYVVADGHWQRYLATVPGLLISRWWWTHYIQMKEVER